MNIKGTLITINNKLKDVNVNPLRLEDSVENKGRNAMEQLYIFHYEDVKVIVYGWKSGEENKINRHELPEPIDCTLFYGDLLVLLREGDDLVDFEVEDYQEFYDYMFSGFSTCDSSDDEILDDEEYDYSDGFIIKDD